MKICINNSFIYYNESAIALYLKDYYEYIIQLIKNILENNDIKLNIVIGMENFSNLIDNNYKRIRIGINHEHTLVKPGGRHSDNFSVGRIKIENIDQYYLVRLDRYNELKYCNIVIDYSIPNITNIEESKLYDEYSKKLLYISPYLYKPFTSNSNRNINTLTTFIYINEPRRANLLNKLKESGIIHNNVNTCFDKNELRNLYCSSKILINIHQTDHHDTFEELRVLPALLCGVIVLCENSPLKELIPYNKYIIWCNYDEITNKIDDIIQHYDEYYNKIFGDESICKELAKLDLENYERLYNKLLF